MKRLGSVLLIMAMATAWLVMAGTAAAGTTLWYTGDFDGSGNSHSNQSQYESYGGGSYFQSNAKTYDDFIVSDGGWSIDSVWSNNRFTSGVTVNGATYEIRSGVSAGNGGTVVASGSGILELTDTGRGTGNYTEYQVLISGLDIQLDSGTYWLNVTPSTNMGDAYSYNSATSGLNSIGTPQGNNGNSFADVFVHYGYGGTYSNYFADTGYTDYSMGVAGTSSTVPVPSTLPLLCFGLLVLTGFGRRIKN